MDTQKTLLDNREMVTCERLISLFDAAQLVAVKTKQKKQKTREFYANQLKKLSRIAGDISASELRPGHLVEVEFTSHFVRAVKTMIRWAVEEEIIVKNHFKKLKTPPTGRRERVMSATEQTKLMRAASPALRRLMWFALRTACRPGELRAMRWSEVDWQNQVVRLVDFKAKDKRKDGVAVRIVPLPNLVFAALKVWHRKAGDNTHVFVMQRVNKPWTPNGLRCAFRAAREKAGLATDEGEQLVMYSCRHTRATELTLNNVRDSLLADILGHTNTAMTRRYLHRAPSDLVKAVQ